MPPSPIDRILAHVAARIIDAAHRAGTIVERAMRQHGALTSRSADALTTADIASARAVGDVRAAESSLRSLPPDVLDTSGDRLAPTTVGPVLPSDGPAIARVHVLASRVAFGNLPGAAQRLDRFLLTDLGPRMVVHWSALARAGDPGLLVARTADGTVAGFIRVSRRADGDGDLNAWYVHPVWHGTGVGRSLIESGIRHLGTGAIHVQTTHGTPAVDIYQRYGFRPVALSDTPPPLHAAGFVAPQVSMILRRLPG